MAKKPFRHKSFKRSYREDYRRDIKLPGLLSHAVTTFKMIFKNWKLFLPLLIIAIIAYIVLVGLMTEETYTQFQNSISDSTESLRNGEAGSLTKASLVLLTTITTGGLSQGMTEVQQVFSVLLFLVIWLVAIYLVRHLLAGHKPKLRDGLYNALTPLISTLVVLAIIFIQAIPIIVVIITYSAAVSTEFLATPFYALVYFIFAALMILLSVYLISSSFFGLVAVTAPGLYPLAAVKTAAELVLGRRIKLIVRMLYLVLVLAVCWVIVMLPVILIDFALKSSLDWLTSVPIVPFFLLLMTVFSIIYFSVYSYLLYRRFLAYEDD